MLLKLAVKTSGRPCGTRFKHVQSALVSQSVPFQDRQNRFDSLCGGCSAQRIAGHVVNEPQPRVCPQRHKRSVASTSCMARASEDDTQRVRAGPAWTCLELLGHVSTVSFFFVSKTCVQAISNDFLSKPSHEMLSEVPSV